MSVCAYHLRTAASQFTTTVSGRAALDASGCAAELTNTRWPSGASSKKFREPPCGAKNRFFTSPTTRLLPSTCTAADAICPLDNTRYRISLPSDRKRGKLPPSVEISHLPPGPGKGTAYTSFRQDSFDSHTTHRPPCDALRDPQWHRVAPPDKTLR